LRIPLIQQDSGAFIPNVPVHQENMGPWSTSGNEFFDKGTPSTNKPNLKRGLKVHDQSPSFTP
jgi:hypothetical protein